ncbi:MAG: hypothetical protein ACTSP3_03265 [Candidatus Heimdallarchaeaceae archaeon]
MNEIIITSFSFFPIVEILYDSDIREHFDILKETTLFRKKLKAIRSRGRQIIEKNGLKLFAPQYTHLYLKWSPDYFIYYYRKRRFLHEIFTLRPFIPIQTLYNKWSYVYKLLDTKKAYKILRFYPMLVGESEKKIIINNRNFTSKEQLLEIINKIKKAFPIEKRIKDKTIYTKECILEALFKKSSNKFLENSPIVTLLEINLQKAMELKLLENTQEKYSIKTSLVVPYGNNIWFFIYDKPTPFKIRERIKRTIKIAYSIRTVRQQCTYLLEKEIFKDLKLEEKFRLVTFIINALNPKLYLSESRTSYYIPQNYQRILFKNLVTKFHELKNYKKLIELLKKKISFCTEDELNYFILNSQYFMDEIVDFILELEPKELYLMPTDEETVVLRYMVEEYSRQMKKTKLRKLCEDGSLLLGALTKNNFRQNIDKWVVSNLPNYSAKFTQKFKQSNKPSILEELEKKQLIITKRSAKGSSQYLYAINPKNRYIKELLKLYKSILI